MVLGPSLSEAETLPRLSHRIDLRVGVPEDVIIEVKTGRVIPALTSAPKPYVRQAKGSVS